jgi:hypothetical protein
LEHQRVAEAKQRLRNFVVSSEMNDKEEQNRLIKYFAHRYVTFIKLLIECVRARKFKPKGSLSEAEKPRHELKQLFVLANKTVYSSDKSEE